MLHQEIHKNRFWKYLTIVMPMVVISFLSCGTSYYYLRHNPDHLLIFDDSYITLKFASNFLKYKAITYDGSTYLTGATSPLHVVLIALLGLFLRLETASLVVGIVFFVFSSVLVYLWTLRIYEDRKVALLAGVLMSTSGWLVFDSLNGLETTTFICLSLMTFYLFYVYEHRAFYVFPLLLSIVTRPEGWFIAGALWMGQVITYIMWRDKQVVRNLFISLCLFVLLITPYFLLYFYYTGSLLPSTAFAKSTFFAEFQVHSKIWLFKHCVELFYKELLYPLPLIVFPLILFARKVMRLTYLWFYYGIFYLCYFLFFPGATLHYWCRYQHIFIPLITIAVSGGALELLKMCKKKALKIAISVVVVASLVYNQSVSFMMINDTYLRATNCTKKTMLDLALWLKRTTPEDSLIALHDIGVVGYFSNRSILDLVGLTNPEVSKYYWDSRSKRPFSIGERKVIDYLKEKKPDYLVILPEWDKYFNFLHADNEKYLKRVYTSGLLFPSGMRYKVFRCDWTL